MNGSFNLYTYAINPTSWIDPLGWCGNTIPNKKTTYQGKSRRDAFRQARRDADIPMSQKPTRVEHVDLMENGERVLGANGKPIQAREYHYTNRGGEHIVIQEHSIGHPVATSGHGADPHFNVRPIENTRNGSVSGTHGHYNF